MGYPALLLVRYGCCLAEMFEARLLINYEDNAGMHPRSASATVRTVCMLFGADTELIATARDTTLINML